MSPNAELVAAIFAEAARGNGRPYFDAFAEDAVWRTIGTTSWSGEFHGKTSILKDIFGPLRDKLDKRATIVSRIIDGGDVIVVQANGRNTTKDGRAYDNDYCFVMTFANGKVVRYEEYCDTELVTSVLGERVAS
jgi:ketosteroid isomerase-like protein